MLPPSPPTDPDVQISCIRFFAGELRSRGISMDDPGSGKRMAFEKRVEAVPWEPFRARSPCQPHSPDPCDLGEIPARLLHIPRDAVVGVVTYELRRQPGVLHEQRLMAVLPTPVVDGDQPTGEPALGRSLSHHVLAFLRLRPGVGEAEEVE